jgi:hypothetical protein
MPAGTLTYMRARIVLPTLFLAFVLAACGGSSKSGTPKASGPTTTGHVAKVASANPSVSAKMICEDEAKKDIADSATGVDTTQPLKPVWDKATHTYSCAYVYPNGAVMTLSVREFSSPDETTAYYNELAQKLGNVKPQYGINGQGAFLTKNGSIVVRKDYKVLLVDISKLPATFGQPPDTRSHVAINTAAAIMNCWKGE